MPSAGVLAVAGATLALALANALATPPFTGNDEAAHVAYALAVADGRLPERHRPHPGRRHPRPAGRPPPLHREPPAALLRPGRARRAGAGRLRAAVRRAALRPGRERAVLRAGGAGGRRADRPGWPPAGARAPVIAAAVAGLVPAYGFVAGFAYNDGLALAAASGLLAAVARRPPATAAAGGAWRWWRCSPPSPRWPGSRRCPPCWPPPCCAPPAGAGATGSCRCSPPRSRRAGSTSATSRCTATRPAAATCSTCSTARGARRRSGVALDPGFWSQITADAWGRFARAAGTARAAARRGRHGVPRLAGAAHPDRAVAGTEPATRSLVLRWRWCGSTPPGAARTAATCTRC